MSTDERENMLKRMECLRVLVCEGTEEDPFWISDTEREEALLELETDIKKIADKAQESFE